MSTADDQPLVHQPMLRLMLEEFGRFHTPAAVETFTREALHLQDQRSSREANRFLLGKLGIDVLDLYDEGYFSEALAYHMGLLHGYCGQSERMSELLAKSRTMPCSKASLIYSDHVAISRKDRLEQANAIARGAPPILISSMPEADGETLAHALARRLEIAVLRLAVGAFPSASLVPSWLSMFFEGGAVTADAFAPSEFNLGVLSSRGPLNVFVLIRDPRAAAASQVRRCSGPKGEGSESAIKEACLSGFLPWLQSWIEVAKTPESPLRVCWLTFGEVLQDLSGTIRTMASVLQSNPFMRAHAAIDTLPADSALLLQPRDDEWRPEVSSKTREQLWDQCSADARALLRLVP